MVQGKMTVDDTEIIEHMQESCDPAFTAAELAERFDMSTNGMRERLCEIKKTGEIRNKKPTARTVIWWHETDYSEPVLSK